jgi:hypothetical protein
VSYRYIPASALALAATLLASVPAFAQVSITTIAVPVTEDFNTLANTGTSSTTPTGWAFAESGTNANATYTAGTGSSNTGDTYSFGAAGSAERAFGQVRSGSLISVVGASFNNATGNVIGSLDIAYAGEQWRVGTVGRLDRLDFQYSLDATSLTTGTWIDVDALDFVAPNTVGPVGAVDGNAAGNRTALFASIGSLSITPGATFWIRWNDLDGTSADDGISVDDFSLTAQSPPVPASSSTWGRVKSLYR